MTLIYPNRLRTALDVDPDPPRPFTLPTPSLRNSASACALDGALRSAQPISGLNVPRRR